MIKMKYLSITVPQSQLKAKTPIRQCLVLLHKSLLAIIMPIDNNYRNLQGQQIKARFNRIGPCGNGCLQNRLVLILSNSTCPTSELIVFNVM